MLRMTETVYQELRKHGEETYPNECCGVMLGVNHPAPDNGGPGPNEVKKAVRAGNIRTDSAHNRYQISPQELVRIQREAREQQLEIVGFYHSHPDHPARWSPTDLAEAHWLGCSYVITAVEQGVAKDTNSFRLAGEIEEEKKFEDELIEVWSTEAGSEQTADTAQAEASGEPIWSRVKHLVHRSHGEPRK